MAQTGGFGFCPQCGEALRQASQRFCHHCGAPTVTATPAATSPPPRALPGLDDATAAWLAAQPPSSRRTLPTLADFRVFTPPQTKTTGGTWAVPLLVVFFLALGVGGQNRLHAWQKQKKAEARYLAVAKEVLTVCLQAVPEHLKSHASRYDRGYEKVEIWGDLYSVVWDEGNQHYFAEGELSFARPGQETEKADIAPLRCTVRETAPSNALVVKEMWVGDPESAPST